MEAFLSELKWADLSDLANDTIFKRLVILKLIETTPIAERIGNPVQRESVIYGLVETAEALATQT